MRRAGDAARCYSRGIGFSAARNELEIRPSRPASARGARPKTKRKSRVRPTVRARQERRLQSPRTSEIVEVVEQNRAIGPKGLGMSNFATALRFDDATMCVDLTGEAATWKRPNCAGVSAASPMPRRSSAIQCRIGGRVKGFHWEELDEDISVEGLLAARRERHDPPRTGGRLNAVTPTPTHPRHP